MRAFTSTSNFPADALNICSLHIQPMSCNSFKYGTRPTQTRCGMLASSKRETRTHTHGEETIANALVGLNICPLSATQISSSSQTTAANRRRRHNVGALCVATACAQAMAEIVLRKPAEGVVWRTRARMQIEMFMRLYPARLSFSGRRPESNRPVVFRQ